VIKVKWDARERNYSRLQLMAQSVSPPQIATMLGKAHNHGQGTKPDCTVSHV